jgi:enoyl-CoA hydratase
MIPPMTYQTLALDVADRIAVLTVNRPDKLNALADLVITELGQAIDALQEREDVGGIILTGAGRAFIAGADISEVARANPVEAKRLARKGQEVFRKFETSPKPTIAAVNGFCLGGGCEIAMACHVRLASEHAKFGQPEVKLGVTPGMGGSQRLTWAVGKAKAMEMCLTGRMMGAEEAERSGLVAKVVPADTLLDEALKTAEKIASMGPLAAIATKEMVNAAFEMNLAQGIVFERRLFHGLFGTEDQKEGMAAFVDKRKAEWKGR